MHLAVGALKPAVRLEQEGLGGGGVYFHIEVFINVHGILEAFKQKLHTHTHTKKSDDCSTTRILFSNPQPLWSYFLCFLSFFFFTLQYLSRASSCASKRLSGTAFTP